VGDPKNVINCLFTTLQEGVHQVRTGFGNSKAHYGGKVWFVPIHGIGQGNGAGPAIWAVVSTPLLNVLREKGFGCEIVCPLSSECFRFIGYAFVDDTDLIQWKLQEKLDIARQELQAAIDTWEFSLKTTCGAIVPEKTVWWLVSFQWTGSSWSYVSLQDSPGELYVNNINNQRKPIKRLEAHQAYKTLCIFLAPDGHLEDQYQKMLYAAIKWADNLRTGNISKQEVWTALQSTILRTLSYPLPALRLT
jgi:PIN domain nuclease of toxin-antitoxin system